MPKLIVFNQVSLDGYFTDRNSDMSWAHKDDPETTSRTFGNGNVLLCYEPVT